MGKIKTWYRSIPIWLAIFLFAAAALIVCSFASDKVTGAAYSKITQISVKYMELAPDQEPNDQILYHSFTGEDGEVVAYQINFDRMTAEDSRRYRFYRLIVQSAPFFLYSSGLLFAALLFYFSKLKKPLALLQNASAKIAENKLDFSLDYAGHDEMARLCRSFEKMRAALDENNLRMLRILDERQQLNDAYTHDLRTPIAVLKGYTELLGKYLPAGKMPQEEVIETVRTMSVHVARLEQFVNSMNTAQRIADLTVKRETVLTEDFVCGLWETATFLCGEKHLACKVDSHVDSDTLNIDPSAVTQVFENLLDNALRFAKSKITVQIESAGQILSIRVTDDGKGFSGKELVTAAKPYYSGQQGSSGAYHFGLGLHICRTLCEKHEGSLKLANTDDGGASVTACFSM